MKPGDIVSVYWDWNEGKTLLGLARLIELINSDNIASDAYPYEYRKGREEWRATVLLVQNDLLTSVREGQAYHLTFRVTKAGEPFFESMLDYYRVPQGWPYEFEPVQSCDKSIKLAVGSLDHEGFPLLRPVYMRGLQGDWRP